MSFGSFQVFLKFEVLECDCVPILGFTFLQQTNPKIDWVNQRVWIERGQCKHHLKTYDYKANSTKWFFALPKSLARVEAYGGLRSCALLLCLA